ncbi:polysaccharide biosynthesis tyrosine autokinase [Colwellia sp. MB02u-18]|uniref:GumC family protein n=1 Tax=unclassified Colwellia TaxID=196834 RepID=UPI0015F6BBD6|nr:MULTISPECIES: polysaccharide biosynthesis tyrosine autokinase [unclassified Colwellia]MBA6225748.1 polysaccharide biosynthesis tyrosine autokinase [Colwellia sp. MB3u-45]MBA6266996.1 polysaccharide biosynthesis tyrosine autokinase [Colwellia sp. MB3u-43]MBA6321908.1 polysaccharide biosynthesis tyrosine autokinase [Colwellia sp. MB02u-19]MBA6325138.1 polysaccharide biosynthesis tyrosine autokinase [Colwellia sp. MB02u-18]MBA6330157.1 polysaccharide biosynthesis tyrosine autokinase [Colwellia
MKTLENEHLLSTNGEIDLKEILTPLWAGRWKILFFTLVITCLTTFYTSLLKPSYRASAILQIGTNKPANTLSINNAFNESNASKEQIQTQFELLRSRKFAERVISQLDLVQHQAFNSGKYNDKLAIFARIGQRSATASVSDLVGQFQQNLSIAPIVGTELVNISYGSYSPQLSQEIANQVGITYLEYQDEIHSASKETTSDWLVNQLEELGKKLQNSELSLQAYREAEGIVDIHGVVGLVGAKLTELSSAALKATKVADDLAISYQDIQQHKGDIKKLSDLPEISSHATLMQLRQTKEKIERKMFELSQRYGPKHPKKIAVHAELIALNKGIVEQVLDIVIAIEKEYFSAVERVNGTKQRLATAKKDYLRLSRLQNKFSQLSREVDTNKELYSNYLVRLKAADAMDNYKANFYVRFIDKAIVPKSPFAPKKSLMIVLAFLLAIMLSSIIIIMREFLMDTLNSRHKLDNFNEAPIIAVLPKIQASSQALKDDSYSTDNRFTEAIRTLRTALLFNSETTPAKIIAVTSSVPSEGKSTVALHLARSFSEMEKVLLIEADMRHPTIAKNMNLNEYRPGLSNLLANTHQIHECIIRDKNVKLDILTSGITPANPLVFLSMKRFSTLIKVFGNFYDRIIIETPPVNVVSDAVIISKLVDSVLYVVHGNKTKREQISAGLKMLKQVNAPIEGVVINHSENIATDEYQNKYYTQDHNIINLSARKRG